MDARQQQGLAAARQRLAAVNASATVQLSFDGVFVPDGRLVDQRPYDPVAAQSEGRRGNGSALAGDDAERLAREAGFLLVFGSRPAIKDALLGRFAGGSVRTPA